MNEPAAPTLGRRAFLGALAAATIPVALSCVGVVPGPSPSPSLRPTATGPTRSTGPTGTLRILQASHPIAASDRYLDAWAQAWGDRQGVSVRIDRVPRADVFARAASEVQAQSGHDLVGHWSHASTRWFESSLVDLTDICGEAAGRDGGFLAVAESIGKLGGTWRLYPNYFVPSLSVWRSDLWQRIGVPAGPHSWQDLRNAAPRLQAAGTPAGTAFSQASAAEQTWRSLFWSYGAAEWSADGRTVAIDSAETRAALEVAKDLFAAADPAVTTWSDLDTESCLGAASCAWTAVSIGAYRAIEARSPAQGVVVGPPLAGPKGRIAAFQSESYGIWRFAQNVELARRFLRDYSADFAGQFRASAGFNFPFLTARLAQPLPLSGADPRWVALHDAASAIRPIGHPGPPTKAAFDALNTHVLTDLVSGYASGKKSQAQAIAEATERLERSLAAFPS